MLNAILRTLLETSKQEKEYNIFSSDQRLRHGRQRNAYKYLYNHLFHKPNYLPPLQSFLWMIILQKKTKQNVTETRQQRRRFHTTMLKWLVSKSALIKDTFLIISNNH